MKNQETKRTDVVTLKFCSELDKYGLEGMLCSSWQAHHW